MSSTDQPDMSIKVSESARRQLRQLNEVRSAIADDDANCDYYAALSAYNHYETNKAYKNYRESLT
jgi:hypothetical protein